MLSSFTLFVLGWTDKSRLRLDNFDFDQLLKEKFMFLIFYKNQVAMFPDSDKPHLYHNLVYVARVTTMWL